MPGLPQRGEASTTGGSCKPCPAARRSTQPGLTLADLHARTGAQPHGLRVALDHEVARGRVALDAGQYRLVPGAFDHATLAALRALAL